MKPEWKQPVRGLTPTRASRRLVIQALGGGVVTLMFACSDDQAGAAGSGAPPAPEATGRALVVPAWVEDWPH